MLQAFDALTQFVDQE